MVNFVNLFFYFDAKIHQNKKNFASVLFNFNDRMIDKSANLFLNHISNFLLLPHEEKQIRN